MAVGLDTPASARESCSHRLRETTGSDDVDRDSPQHGDALMHELIACRGARPGVPDRRPLAAGAAAVSPVADYLGWYETLPAELTRRDGGALGAHRDRYPRERHRVRRPAMTS